MWRLFQAGLVAACIQCVAVSLVTLGILLAAQHELINLAPPDANANAASGLNSILPLLRWIYLLIALGVALTSDRFVDFTAAHIRLASRLISPADPDHATNSLLTQLALSSIGFSALALRPPPEPSIAAARSLGFEWLASPAWSGIMSMAAASSGANAQAARRAL
jgi:hypothetical protein